MLQSERFYFWYLLEKLFFLSYDKSGDFCHSNLFFFFFLPWPGKVWEKFVEGRRDSFVRNDENWRLHKTSKDINSCGQTSSPCCRFLYVVWVVSCVHQIAKMMMEKMMLQVSPISLSSLTKPLLHTYRTKRKKRKKMLSPLHDKFHSTTAPFARVHTLFCFFFSWGPFWWCVAFQHESFSGPPIQLGLRRHRVCATSNVLFIPHWPTGQRRLIL